MPLFDDNQRAVVTNLLPKYLSPERFFSLCELANRSYQLKACTPGSILKCLIEAAEIGLEPNTPLQHCYLIPFKHNKTGQTYATLVIGWRGLVHKAIMCGAAKRIVAGVVRQGDTFKYRPLDPVTPILHEPLLDADDSKTDDIVGAYAVAFLPDGDVQAEYMSRKQIDRIHARSKAANDGPWVTDFAEMARKCPTRRLAKYLRMTGDLDEVARFGKTLEIDNLFDSGTDEDDDAPPAITAGSSEPNRTVNPEPKTDAPRRARPPKAQEAPKDRPVGAGGPAEPKSTAGVELCGFCKKPGHSFNDCPENQSVSGETVIEPEKPQAAPEPAKPEDRTIGAAEYDDLMNEARKAHPQKTMTWLMGVLETNFKIDDLSELKVSQIPMLTEAMTKG